MLGFIIGIGVSFLQVAVNVFLSTVLLLYVFS